MSGRLAGRHSLITGASSGIGRAVAEAFVAAGARVCIVAAPADAEELEAVARALGPDVVARTCDLSEARSARTLVADAIADLSSLDVLVNNAGSGTLAPTLEVSPEAWDRTMAVNLRSAFVLSQAFAAHVIGRGGSGSIVNTASLNGLRPEPMLAAYNASKAGLISLTQSLALELGRSGIRVNAVMPAMVETRQTAELLANGSIRRMYESAIPLGRVALPEDVAPAYVFLASDDAAYITGALLPVDGGISVGIAWPEPDGAGPDAPMRSST